MADLGKATVQVELDLSGVRSGLVELQKLFQTSIGSIEKEANTRLGAIGRAGGAAYSTGVASGAQAAATALSNSLNSASGAVGAAAGSVGRSGGSSFSSAFGSALNAATGGLSSAFGRDLGVSMSAVSAGVGKLAGSQVASSMASAIKSGSGAVFSAGKALGQSMTSYWSNIGRQMGYSINMAITRGIQGGFAALLNTKNIEAFDAASRKVAQLTKDQRGMEASSQALSKELRYSVNSIDLLKAGYETLSSGITGTANVMNVLRAASKATVASQGEARLDKVNDAITSIINSYKQWGMSAKDADAIINQISGTVDAGKIKYGEYAQQIGKAAAITASAGVSFSELNTAIAKATIGGQLPESVLSGIPGLITNIQKPTKIAVATAAELGVQFDAAALKSKGLLGVLEDIAKARTADGRSGKDGEIITRLFGNIRGRNVATSIIQDTAGARDIQKQIAQGNVDKNFDLATGGITAKKTALTNRLIELDIKIKEGAIGKAIAAGLEIAGRVVEVFANALEGINQAYQTLSPSQQAFVNAIGGVAVAVTGAVVAIGVAGVAIGLFGSGLTAAIGLIGGFAVGLGQILIAAAPIAIPIGAISLAVYGLAKAFGATNTQAFVAALTAAGVGVAAVFGPAVVGAVTTATVAVVTSLAAIGATAAAALIPLLPWIAAAAAIGAALYGLKVVYDNNKAAIDAWAAGVAKAMAPAFDAIKKFVDNVIKFVGNFLVASFKLAWAIIVKAVEGLVFVFRFASPAITLLIWAIGKAIELVSGIFKNNGNSIEGIVAGIRNAIASAFGAAGKKLDEFRAKIPILDAALNSLGKGFEVFKLVVETRMHSAGQALQGFFDLGSNLTKEFLVLIKKIGEAFNSLPNIINRAADSINTIKIPNFGGGPAPAPSGPQVPRELPPAQTYGPPSPAAAVPSGNENDVVLVATDDLSGLGLGKLMARRPKSSRGVTVQASQYHPGGGGDNGAEEDARGRRLTANDYVVAIPGLKRGDSIPYGTIIRITNPATGRSTQASVRDTGPLAPGRELDMTTAVAKAIGFQGLGPVQVEIVKLPPGADPNKTYQFGRATSFNTRNSEWANTTLPGTSIRADGAAIASSPVREESYTRQVRAAKTTGDRLADQAERTIGIYKGVGLQCATTVRQVAKLAGVELAVTDRPGDSAVVGNYTNPARANSFGGANDYIIRRKEDLRRGDIVQWRDTYAGVNGRNNDGEITHVGLYLGNGRYYHHGKKAGGRITGDPGFQFAQGIRPNGVIESSGNFERGSTATNTAAIKKQQAADLALKQAREDLAAAEKRLEELKAEGARANTPAAKAAHQRRLNAAEETVRKKKQQVEKAGLGATNAAPATTAPSADDQRTTAVNEIKSIMEAAQSRYNLANKKIENSGASQLSQDIEKAENLKKLQAELEQLKPQIDALRKIYGGTRDGQIAIDSLESAVQEAIAQSRAAQQTVEAARQGIDVATTDQIIAQAEQEIQNADAKKEEVENAVKRGGRGAPTPQQGEIKKALVDSALIEDLEDTLDQLRRYKETIADDTEGAEKINAEIAKITRLQADRTADLRQGGITRISDEIVAIQGRRADQVSEIKHRQSVGDITAEQAEERTALALKKENEELNSLLPLLDAYRKAWAGDDQATKKINDLTYQLLNLETEYRNVAKAAEAARQATQVSKGKKETDAQLAFANAEQESIKHNQAIGVLPEAEAARALLESRQRTAEVLRESLRVAIELRTTLTDPAAIEAANEHIAAMQQYVNETEAAAYAYQKAQREATLLHATTKTLVTDLNEGFRAVFKDAFTGFKNLSSILDGILNKIADMGINALFESLGGSGGGGLLGPLGALFGLKDGGPVKNYSSGGPVGNTVASAIRLQSAYSKAMRREGAGAVPLVAKVGEQVLNIDQAKAYRAAVKDGTWQQIERMYHYNSGGTITATGPKAVSTPQVSGDTSNNTGGGTLNLNIATTPINGVEYATIDQLRQAVSLAVQASEAKVSQNLTSSSFRAQYNIK